MGGRVNKRINGRGGETPGHRESPNMFFLPTYGIWCRFCCLMLFITISIPAPELEGGIGEHGREHGCERGGLEITNYNN